MVFITIFFPFAGATNLYHLSSSGKLPPSASEQIALGPFCDDPLETSVEVHAPKFAATDTVGAKEQSSAGKPVVNALGPA